jgi:pyridoxamine 5'-phosphate oxidase
MAIKFKNIDDSEPYRLFHEKYKFAQKKDQKNIDALCISSYNTIKKEVSSRYVNLKYINKDNWVFFTNYNSPKSNDFLSHEQISAVFFWNKSNIQIRMKAKVKKISEKESDIHFMGRSTEKNALAISSNQSAEISSFQDIKSNYEHTLKNLLKEDEVARPNSWGGFSFKPYYFEFWEGSDFRLNNRVAYSYDSSNWKASFLAP